MKRNLELEERTLERVLAETRQHFLNEINVAIDPSGRLNKWIFIVDSDRDIEALRVVAPQRVIPIIAAPGSFGIEGALDPCFSLSDAPPLFTNLAGERLGELTIKFFYYCNRDDSTSRIAPERTRDRTAGMVKLAEALRARGVPSSRIFLTGKSSGGWSALSAARTFPEAFNASIAVAPGDFGLVEDRKKAAFRGNQEYLTAQARFIGSASRLDALVFAFSSDEYVSMEDLSFLSEVPGVTFVPLRYAGHNADFDPDFGACEAKTVMQFIAARIDQEEGSSLLEELSLGKNEDLACESMRGVRDLGEKGASQIAEADTLEALAGRRGKDCQADEQGVRADAEDTVQYMNVSYLEAFKRLRSEGTLEPVVAPVNWRRKPSLEGIYCVNQVLEQIVPAEDIPTLRYRLYENPNQNESHLLILMYLSDDPSTVPVRSFDEAKKL